MKLRNWFALGGMIAGGVIINSFLPRRLSRGSVTEPRVEPRTEVAASSALPAIDVTFLRCGSAIVPECLAVRGTFSCAPYVLSHSAVLIQHPQATFLYDSGLGVDIELFLMDQSFFFHKTLGNFVLEQPIGAHLQRLGMKPTDLDFVLLSHLHWDHVGGIPDLPGVPLRINRVEYEVANQGLLDQNQGLVRRLLSNNPVDLLDFAGPAYEGFGCSYDLFNDGSIILVPLPGHTSGQIGMFINRSNGPRIFLIADAAWFSTNYQRPATFHPLLWTMVTADRPTACQTLLELHRFSQQHPEVAMIATHDGHMQEAFARVERAQRTTNVQ